MRTEKKVAIIVAICLIVAGFGLASISAMAAGGNVFNLIKKDVNTEEKTYDINKDFENIEIRVGSKDIRIEKSSDKDAHFVCYENENVKYDVNVEGKTLKIEQKNTNKLNLLMWDEGSFNDDILYLPKDQYESFTGNLGSGDFSILTGLKFSELSLEVGSGDISLDSVNCTNKLNVHCGSGSIKAENVDSEGSLVARTGSGNIRLNSCEGVTVELKAGSGDIELDSCDGTSISIATSSGDVSGTLKTGKKFDAHAGSGSVRVPSDSGEGTCTVKTGSGDIELSVLN